MANVFFENDWGQEDLAEAMDALAVLADEYESEQWG